jgi:hypothetical protein
MCARENLLIVVTFSILLCPAAHSVDISLNVQEMGHLNETVVGGLADVWGWYNSQDGRYYALICGRGDLEIVDATDPQNSSLIGSSQYGLNPDAVDVKVVGNYAYVASQRGGDLSSIWIYDLQYAVDNPNSPPQWWLTLDDEGAGNVLIDNCHTLFATEDYLFLAEGNYSDAVREVAILSLQDLTSPSVLAIWGDNASEPDFVWPHAVYARGTTAYIFDYSEGTYKVDFDGETGDILYWEKIWYDTQRGNVRNTPEGDPHGNYDCGPGEPKRAWSHSGWLTEDGNYVVVADEFPGGWEDCQPKYTPCLRIFNLDQFYEPQDPDEEVISLANAFDIIWNGTAGPDQYVIGPAAIDQATEQYGDATPCPIGDCLYPGPDPEYFHMGIHNPVVKGRLAFLAWYARGLQVLDISNIADIRHAGYADHGTGTDGDWINEAYGVYPFSPDGYIYVSGTQGLYIYRYGYTGTLAENTTWRGDVYVYETLTVPANVTLTILPGTKVHMFPGSSILVTGTNSNLTANGTEADSVYFFALGPNPQPGDWLGIHFLNGSAGTLQYCAIRHAVIGIEMEDFSDVEMDNCLIKSNRLRESTPPKSL